MAFPSMGGAGPAVLSHRPGTSPNIVRIPMDMGAAQQYWDFYHGSEPLIDACKKHRHDATFQGPLEINWGGGEIDAVRLDAPGDQAELKNLFRTALVWYDVFGMVPVIMRKRAKIAGSKPRVAIPPFGIGAFVIELDTKSFDVNVVFEITVRGRSSSAAASRSRVGPNAVQFAAMRGAARPAHGSGGGGAPIRVLDVFVWPGHEPNPATTQFHSTVQSLLEPFTRIAQLRENMMVADRASARPLLLTESRPETGGVERQTERQLLGLVGDPSAMGPDAKRHYDQDVQRADRLERMAQQSNAAARGVSTPFVTGRSRRVAIGAAAAFGGNIEPLPDGETLARQVVARSTTDLIAYEERYANTLCVAMGVPLGYIRGDGGARIKGETDQMRSIFRAAVDRDRRSVSEFYSWAHEQLYRGRDDKFLAEALIQTDTIEAAERSGEDKARTEDVRRNIAAIAALPQRVQVDFAEDPLPRTVDLAMLQAAAAAGACTIEEQANILRGQLGLPSIDQDHALLRQTDAAEAPYANPETHERGSGNAAGVGVVTTAEILAVDAAEEAAKATAEAAAAAAAAAPAPSPQESAKSTADASTTDDKSPGDNDANTKEKKRKAPTSAGAGAGASAKARPKRNSAAKGRASTIPKESAPKAKKSRNS